MCYSGISNVDICHTNTLHLMKIKSEMKTDNYVCVHIYVGNSHYYNYNLSLVANTFVLFCVWCEYVYNHMGECTPEHMLPILGNSFEFFSLLTPDKHTGT